MRTLRSDRQITCPESPSKHRQKWRLDWVLSQDWVEQRPSANSSATSLGRKLQIRVLWWFLGSMQLYQGFPQPQFPHHPPEWEQVELQPGHSPVIWTHNEVNLLMHEPQSMGTSSDGESSGRWPSAWRPREVSPRGEHAIVLAGPPQTGGFFWAEKVNSFSSLKEDAAQPPKGHFEMSHWLKMFHVII